MKWIGTDRLLYVLRVHGVRHLAKIGVSNMPWQRARVEGKRLGKKVEIASIWRPTEEGEDLEKVELRIKHALARKAVIGREWFRIEAEALNTFIWNISRESRSGIKAEDLLK